jgi:glycosyltransferase involved in cell wall biosynthesis
VLEAMKLGLPVVLSTGGSLPEVGGDAVLYVDPLDPHAMAEGLAQILDDTSLAAELSAKGRVQARRFTWDQAARSTLEAFRQAIG